MTDFVAGRLLVGGFPRSDDTPWLVELREALASLGLRLRLTAATRRRVDRLREVQGPAADLLESIWVSSVVVEPVAGGRAPQAWWVLERLRHRHPELAARISLPETRRRGSMGADALGARPARQDDRASRKLG